MGDFKKLHTRAEIEAKIFSLAMVQTIGPFVALFLQLSSHPYIYNNSQIVNFVINLLLMMLGFLGVIFGVFSQPATVALETACKAKIKGKFPFLIEHGQRLKAMTHIFATADLLALSFLICSTGGSERSFYAPFLFIIPPVIVLIDLLPWIQVFGYAFFAMTIYGVGLIETTRFYFIHAVPVQIVNSKGHKLCMIVSTSLSFLLPLIFDLAKSPSAERKIDSLEAPLAKPECIID